MCRALLLAWAMGTLGGCATTSAQPELLGLLDLAPRSPQMGERIELVGTGFPEGRAATLFFRGDLYRPGRPVKRGVSIGVAAQGSRSDRLTLVVNEELARRFSCSAEDPEHTTFRGEVTASFAPRKIGAPPISGTLRDVVVVFPPPSLPDRLAADRSAEASRVLGELGIELKLDPESGGLIVTEVRPQGPAAEAGLLPGDMVTDFDGALVSQTSDLIPRPGAHYSQVLVRRAGLPEPVERTIRVEGIRPAAAAEFTPAGILVGVAAASLVLERTALTRLLSWIQGRIAARIACSVSAKQLSSHSLSSWARATRRAFLGYLVAPDLSPVCWLAPQVLCLGVTLLFLGFALGLSFALPELDLPLVLLSSVTALLASAFLATGTARWRHWSLGSRMRQVLATLTCQVPIVAAFACAVLGASSSRPDLLVEKQGGLPWQWTAFGSPIELAALVLIILCLVPMSGLVTGELPEAVLPVASPDPLPNTAQKTLTLLADWAHVLLLSHLTALVFLGGWSLPFMPSSGDRPAVGYLLAGAVWLILKSWAVLATVLGLRWAFGQIRIAQVAGLCARWALPVSLLLLCLRVACRKLGLLASLPTGAVRVALLVLGCFVAIRLARRVISGLGKTGRQLEPDPWI